MPDLRTHDLSTEELELLVLFARMSRTQWQLSRRAPQCIDLAKRLEAEVLRRTVADQQIHAVAG